MLFRSNDTATTEIYTFLDTLSLHDALPIYRFDEIARAFADVHHGRVIKPVLLMDGVQA